MSRWNYPAIDVTVDGNTQKVRKLTAGERKSFIDAAGQIRDGKMSATELPFLVAAGTGLTREELSEMPPDLLDACVEKISELSGLTAAAGESGEKKA